MSLTGKLASLQARFAFQWLPPALVRAAQLRRLRAMLAFVETEVPLYRESFRRAGVHARDLRTIQDLAAFPMVTREEVVAAYPDGILSRPVGPRDVEFRTSGTSGLFMRIAYSESANDFLDAVYARALFATGYRPWHRFAYFWWEDRPKSLRVYERLGLMKKTFLPVDPDPDVQLRALAALRPHFVYHFPSSLRMIAQRAVATGTTIRPRGVVCHGEFLPEEVGREIGRAFGCPVWNQYGAQEFNRLGWDCARHDGLHLDADSVVLEVLDGDRPAPDGQTGELCFTGLENRLMPLVRYRIGDLGRTLPGRCACGRGLPRFEITEGRADDVLSLAGGRTVGPRSLAPRIEALDGFSQYRVVQKTVDRLEVLFVRVAGAPPALGDTLAAVVRDVVGPGIHVDARPVDEIPLSRRGKLRKVVSELR